MLLPYAALREAAQGELDRAAQRGVFLDLLMRYGIGASAAAHHLWNRRLLSSPSVRDDLIDRFASAAV